jgi:hypothetical protein
MPKIIPGWIAALAIACTLTACSTPAAFVPPNTITAPYDSIYGEALWAIVPPVNESGTSVMDPLEVGDAIVGAVSEIRGVSALPLNRTIQAMRALNLDQITSPRQVEQLAKAMGVDGIIVPSVSAWDPYDPPVIGLSLALYAKDGSKGAAGLDPKALSIAPTDAAFLSNSNFADRPVIARIEHLDARNHQVKMWVREYAQGRSDAGSALNWRIYFASMDLYTEFAAYHLVRQIIQDEWIRTAHVAAK